MGNNPFARKITAFNEAQKLVTEATGPYIPDKVTTVHVHTGSANTSVSSTAEQVLTMITSLADWLLDD